MFSHTVVQMVSWKFLKFCRCPSSEKEPDGCPLQLLDCLLDPKKKNQPTFSSAKKKMLVKTEKWKTPHTALSAAISMADKHPHETFLLYQKCLCLSPDSEQKSPTPSGSPLNQVMAHPL